jgi:uncharacterized membrane protein
MTVSQLLVNFVITQRRCRTSKIYKNRVRYIDHFHEAKYVTHEMPTT